MITVDWQNKRFSNDRVLLRQEIINEFLNENPGTGNGNNASRYRYDLIITPDIKIYLKRPTRLNKGFDFTLNVEGITFIEGQKKTTRPTHENILKDLKKTKEENDELYSELRAAIDRIYHCQEVSLSQYFQTGIPVEILLECIKWLFIEQDVAYWNYSGRQMFYNAICDI